jgi:hypothetical protein
MRALARLLGLKPQDTVCLDEIRAARVAEIRQLLVEIAEQPASCSC